MDEHLSSNARWILAGIFVGLGLLAFFLLPPAFRPGLRKRSGVRLSQNTRWILAGLSLSLLLLLFPPFWYGGPYTMGARQWHFFLDSRHTTESGRRMSQMGVVDLPMLFLEFLMGGVGIGAIWYVTTSLQDKDEA